MKNYLKYAFGEIILVVIGILIALFIKGKYNEQEELTHIKRTGLQVLADLQKDTANTAEIIIEENAQKELFLAILSDTMDRDFYDSCNFCPYLISRFQAFEPSTHGFSILKNQDTDLKTSLDTLIHDTKQFYARQVPLFEIVTGLVEEEVTMTLNYWKSNYPWFADWVLGHPPLEFDRYMHQNPDFRNRVASYWLINYGNFVPYLEAYQIEATQLAKRWDKELN
ncbi:MAG: hypothetical protein RIC95_00080 [Vicingaceae bacterium]